MGEAGRALRRVDQCATGAGDHAGNVRLVVRAADRAGPGTNGGQTSGTSEAANLSAVVFQEGPLPWPCAFAPTFPGDAGNVVRPLRDHGCRPPGRVVRMGRR